MLHLNGLNDSFQFLVLEVTSHIRKTSTFLAAPEPELFEQIVSKDDYIDNLKNSIENACFQNIASAIKDNLSKNAINTCRSMQTIAVNLERIADFCVNIARQVQYLSDPVFLQEFDYQSMIREILSGIEEIPGALRDKDLPSTLRICRKENTLDHMYKVHFDRIMAALQKGPRLPGDYITIVFIIRYLERIGDSLLNIGEAILFSIIGEKIKINQFQALQQNLTQSGLPTQMAELDLQFIWGTRSGCRIGRVEDKAPERAQARQDSIFKEGASKKIRKEKHNLQRWQQIFPGLVPKIFSFYEDEVQDQASLLVELLPGCTLDETVLTSDMETIRNAAFILFEVLEEIWPTTLIRQNKESHTMRQLVQRMDQILQVHPKLTRQSQSIGTTYVPSTKELIRACADIERELPAPFTVFIHGDFNMNNVVYSHGEQKIHFIDLHRSTQGDYVQDVSVFLISNFRMPVFDPVLRGRLNWMIQRMFAFAQDFAREQGDTTFQARLALALARSFYTSSRFELNMNFAKEMFFRAHFLMDRMYKYREGNWEAFTLPQDVLWY